MEKKPRHALTTGTTVTAAVGLNTTFYDGNLYTTFTFKIYKYECFHNFAEMKLLTQLQPVSTPSQLKQLDHLLGIPVMVAVMAMIGWTALGCFLVHLYLPTAQTSLAFYFIFNSLATIGVGDVEPGGEFCIFCAFHN
ncbi:unnamed protein product [Gongylonema pulchrum]|uniref:Ion_trans_2 domain-containing protein n=1 Tax=Gongylonema pulchrum TaxID=637853 RepID=A0A183EXE0_9BILA|nr:unnamed protein product [Gongylonema pulchrum]